MRCSGSAWCRTRVRLDLSRSCAPQSAGLRRRSMVLPLWTRSGLFPLHPARVGLVRNRVAASPTDNQCPRGSRLWLFRGRRAGESRYH
jgi:hypothetical protein